MDDGPVRLEKSTLLFLLKQRTPLLAVNALLLFELHLPSQLLQFLNNNHGTRLQNSIQQVFLVHSSGSEGLALESLDISASFLEMTLRSSAIST